MITISMIWASTQKTLFFLHHNHLYLHPPGRTAEEAYKAENINTALNLQGFFHNLPQGRFSSHALHSFLSLQYRAHCHSGYSLFISFIQLFPFLNSTFYFPRLLFLKRMCECVHNQWAADFDSFVKCFLDFFVFFMIQSKNGLHPS